MNRNPVAPQRDRTRDLWFRAKAGHVDIGQSGQHVLRNGIGHGGRLFYGRQAIDTHRPRRERSVQASTIWPKWWPALKVGHIGWPAVLERMILAASMILVSL